MKKLWIVAGVGLSALVLLLPMQSCGVLGGPPQNVQIAADSTGLMVTIAWGTPAEGIPDKYLVHFQAKGDSGYNLIAETTAASIFHNPDGSTGTYKVAAQFGSDVYEADEMPTTMPVYSDTVVLAELDAVGNSGFGWDRTTGYGGASSMLDAGNAAYIDFYISDFMPGSTRQPYAIASPDRGPDDSSGTVPVGDWRVNGFTDSMPTGWSQDTLPGISPTRYFDYTEIFNTPMLTGFYSTADERYGLIRVISVNYGVGEVELESWFQLVPRLRLIGH